MKQEDLASYSTHQYLTVKGPFSLHGTLECSVWNHYKNSSNVRDDTEKSVWLNILNILMVKLNANQSFENIRRN